MSNIKMDADENFNTGPEILFLITTRFERVEAIMPANNWFENKFWNGSFENISCKKTYLRHL